jgi:double-stranded uracil-DNA glycosylase
VPLRDVLTPHPRILFVGINPGLRSEALGHHFAGPGNPFWRLLHAAGLIPEPIVATEDRRLAQWGLALTNLCPRASRSAAELRPEEIARGRRALLRKIARLRPAVLRPAVVALVGVSLYRWLFPGAPGGAGLKPETIAGATLFVLPNPSGLNASYPGFADKLIWFERLRELVSTASPA